MKRTRRCRHDPSFKGSNFVITAGLFCLGALMLGCPANKKTQDRIVIKGSNTVGEELAPRLIAEYKKGHPAVMIDLETRGTGSGFYGLFAGACDIATASRGLLTNELAQAESRKIQLDDAVIGAYSVAVVVNAANPVHDLTTKQVRDIFIGVIHNWKDVGGSDSPIHQVARDPVSGTYFGFRELAMENKGYTTNLTTFTNYSGIVEAVGRDANAIGYSSIQLAGKSGTQAVSIGGIAPTASAVNEGKYPYARVLHFFTNKSAESPATREFVQFVQASQGKQILDQMGFTPRP